MVRGRILNIDKLLTLVKRKDIDQTAGRMRPVWYVISANRDALQTE